MGLAAVPRSVNFHGTLKLGPQDNAEVRTLSAAECNSAFVTVMSNNTSAFLKKNYLVKLWTWKIHLCLNLMQTEAEYEYLFYFIELVMPFIDRDHPPKKRLS